METPESFAESFEEAAAELTRAAEHLKSAAAHFRNREIPRACAHACSAQGHIDVAQQKHRHWLRVHAARSTP
jgi:hypothetical protein